MQHARRQARQHRAIHNQVAHRAVTGQRGGVPHQIGRIGRRAAHLHGAFVDQRQPAIGARAGNGQLAGAVLGQRARAGHHAGIGAIRCLSEFQLTVVDNVALDCIRIARQNTAAHRGAAGVGIRAAQQQQARAGLGQAAIFHRALDFHPLRHRVAHRDGPHGAAQVPVVHELQAARTRGAFAEGHVALLQHGSGDGIVGRAGGLQHRVVAEHQRARVAQRAGAANADFARVQPQHARQVGVGAGQDKAIGRQRVHHQRAVAGCAGARQAAAHP